MNKIKELKKFTEHELILTKEEARIVLRFFWPQYTDKINEIHMDDKLRGFSQAILVEAIDASYAMGHVEALYQGIISVIVPTDRSNSTIRLIKSFARAAATHWFNHATAQDLASVRIYETIRRVLSRSLKVELERHLNGIAMDTPSPTFINYASALDQSNWRWG